MSSKADTGNLFPDSHVNSILSDKEISEFVQTGRLITSNTYSQKSLGASSYDIRVGVKGVVGGVGVEMDLSKEVLELAPGAYGGIISFEKLTLPKSVFARIGTKRAVSYDGIILLTGSIVDPGYEGHLLFGLYNASQRKVLIRQGRKICNIVFERIQIESDIPVVFDPDLRNGNFPETFLDRMVNMDVLPWMQISERVKQIENITKDIIDLKARYEDVLQPIKDLTKNVDSLTKDIHTLSQQTLGIAEDLEKTQGLVSENSKQITSLTQSLTILSTQTLGLKESITGLSEDSKRQMETITNVKSDFGRYKVLSYIFWAVVTLIAGGLITKFIDKIIP